MTKQTESWPSATVVAFKPRRAYLDACREQGVHSANLELEAEISELTARAAATKRQIARLSGELDTNPPIALASHNPATAKFTNVLKQREAEIVLRFKMICQHYVDAGCGDEHFRLLMCLLFDVSVSPEQTIDLFEAAQIDRAQRAMTAIDDALCHSNKQFEVQNA